jgi:signal peptidase I
MERQIINQNSNTNNLKKAWKWIWNSDSAWSWIVALLLIFVFIKFIFFPAISLIMGTSLPLAGVESSSMDHQIISDGYSTYNICGKIFDKQNIKHLSFDDYWNNCGSWYEEKNISKTLFSSFSLSSGFSKGDIIIVWGRFTPKIGDIIIFGPNQDSLSPHPIIHRIVSINNNIIQTKGDHNQAQLTANNNIYKTDETNIQENQIIGKAIFKVPYLGWPKVWLSDIIKNIFY